MISMEENQPISRLDPNPLSSCSKASQALAVYAPEQCAIIQIMDPDMADFLVVQTRGLTHRTEPATARAPDVNTGTVCESQVCGKGILQSFKLL